MTNAADVALRGAAVVESVGVSAGVGESTTVVGAGSEEFGGRSGEVVGALRVSAGPNTVVVLVGVSKWPLNSFGTDKTAALNVQGSGGEPRALWSNQQCGCCQRTCS